IQHPEGRHPQQQIAGGCPSDGGDQANNVRPKPIDVFSGSQTDTAYCKSKGSDQIQNGGNISVSEHVPGTEYRIKGKDINYSYLDRKSTRLNSSHVKISYAVFCLKKKTPVATSA